MSPTTLPLLLTLCLTFFLTPSHAINNEDDPTAYEVLEDYGFPRGLLPKGALGYELDKQTGKFAAYFNGSCSFSLEGSYQLNYKSTIKGYISDGKLKDLDGISVKIWFIWCNIDEVDRKRDNLEFSVGIASADFPVENFDEQPQCGCGLNCVESDLNGKQTTTNRFVDYY